MGSELPSGEKTTEGGPKEPVATCQARCGAGMPPELSCHMWTLLPLVSVTESASQAPSWESAIPTTLNAAAITLDVVGGLTVAAGASWLL